MWLHAFLFVLHPVLLGLAGAWRFAPLAMGGGGSATQASSAFVTLGGMRIALAAPGAGHAYFAFFLIAQTALTAAFLGYQLLYWNGPWKPALQPAA